MTNIRNNFRLSRTTDLIVRLILLLLSFVMLALSVVQLSGWYSIRVIKERSSSWKEVENALAVGVRGISALLYFGNMLSGLLLLFGGFYCAYCVSCLFGLFHTDKQVPYGDFLLVSILGFVAYVVPFLALFFPYDYDDYQLRPTAYSYFFLIAFLLLTVFSASLYVMSRKKGKEENYG